MATHVSPPPSAGVVDEKTTAYAEHDLKNSSLTRHDGYDDVAQFEFDAQAEKKLRRKIDMYIVPTVALLYLFCFIDRANIGNARIAGLEKDLGINPKSFDYNIILSCFYISYIVFEIPATILAKALGPGWFIPAAALGFGILTVCCGLVQTFSQICGVRFLLGIFEAGMLPGIAYYMSRWYRRSELAFRISLYLVMAPLAGAFGGLFASAILKLDHFGSMHSWRMIFGIEGIITIGLSLIAFLTLTDRPETARWLTAEEKALAVNRIHSEIVGQKDVLDRMDKTKLKRGIFNPVGLVNAVIFLFDNITVQALAFFLPTIVRGIYPKQTVIQQQLKTVPPYVVGAFCTLAIPFASSKLNKRVPFFIMCAPLVMIGYIMFLATGVKDGQIRYGATFIIVPGAFAFGALCTAHASANAGSDTAKSSAIGTTVMFGNIGGLISTWSFVGTDAPNYPIGNGLNLATSTSIFILSIALLWWMKADNRKRDSRNADAELAGREQKEIEDLDWKHPGFRWRP
ncbi:mfs transporter like protein [Zymoseptoria brevis]|uniref:Mfs transporter like protein n=1 Tax=Zymoseptoria brevis TaxID=1047168 RepID=A0A0F4GAD2_9PEZI|nr:mfs transporter like protein [Zymoseptoria brevis]